MNRRIILVDFHWTRDKDPRIPLGHASLVAALRRQADLDVRSVAIPVNTGHYGPEDVVRDVLRESGDIDPQQVDIAFGAYVWGEELLQGVLPGLRAAGFRGRLILGGPQISYSGPRLEHIYPDADVFVRGYGEQALTCLATTAERQQIPGVHWAGTSDLQTQADVELESLPSPWLAGGISLRNQRFIRWETQRGCPFRCAFCQHREPGAHLQRRSFGIPRIEAEIDLFCRSDVREIAVLDPIFNMAPHAVAVLDRFSEQGFAGRLSLQCRAETIDDEFLAAASCLDVCLELGLQTIHQEEGRAIRRHNHVERVDQTLARVRSRNMRHEVSLIFGLPLQTLASFEASIGWCLEREVPVIKAFPLLLLRGTGLDRDRQQWNLEDSGGDMPMVLRSDSFDIEDWCAMARLSEALRLTEGRHPRRLTELKTRASSLDLDLFRWLPGRFQRAA